MRVIGGTARRRQLRAPPVPGLRPTSDRVREAIFDILASLGAVEDASVLDAYAGSGALGIEALSRGAGSVCFVESDPRAVSAIRANLDSTGFGNAPGVRVVRADVHEFLAGEAGTSYELALVDPPYSFADWPSLLSVLRADVAVLESSAAVEVPETFVVRREYRYGGTLVTLVEARGPGRNDPRTTEKDPV
ncbi:MAG TPA: RsmD family RNA methyltransferase [Acidimicrobiales bacterium]|nr:RsmD family RNA methyltransferase [Acidimicrobiales bacterium]